MAKQNSLTTRLPQLSCVEILERLVTGVWQQRDTDGDPPTITPESLRKWMPEFPLNLIPQWLKPVDHQASEPEDWVEAAWYHLRNCINQFLLDAPPQDDANRQIRIYEKVPRGSMVKLDASHVIFPDQPGPYNKAVSAMLAVLGAWTDKTVDNKKQDKGATTFDDGIVLIHELWDDVYQRGQGNFTHPLAPIVKQWITETTAKQISKEYDRKHPVAILKHSVGNIREIVPSASNWNDELGEVKGVSAPAPKSDQIEIPGIEIPDSVLPATLPLQAIKIVEGMTTGKRGALAMPVRLFLEAVMALDPKETRADILIRLGDLLHFLNPDGKYNRTNHLPYVLKALHSLYYLRIPYRENPNKPSTEVDWIPIVARTVPNRQSGDDAPILLEVNLPPNARNGRMVEKDILRLLGKQSAARTHAYLTACGLFDTYGTVGQGIIDVTKPVERRNADGNLITPSGTLIFDSKGNPITDPYDPDVVGQLDRIPNEARTKYPILSFDDLIRACFPNGYPKGERAKYLKRALTAWERLHADGIMVIEKHQDGWRIMPSESHIGRYRALKKATQVY